MDEDITVRNLSSRVGKSLLLEVKTADWSRQRWEHRLTIDVDQLRRYQSSPIPVYYVFPMPPWPDVLTDGHGWLMGRHRSELIDPGHGWFGDWLFVVRAQTLWAWLGWRQKQKSASLYASSGGPSSDPSCIWPEPSPWWRWPDFWDEMSRCGSHAMPSMFTCPAGVVPSDHVRPGREALTQSLTSGRGELGPDRWGAEVERFIPDEGTAYRPVAEGDFLQRPFTSGAAGRSTALLHLSVDDLDL